MQKYDFKTIEPKWQEMWDKQELYKAEDLSKKPKWYTLVEFPYPSGAGLHVGHVRSYTALDVVSRKLRMQGYNVLYPIGWDAFGLPTENYAIKNKIHPRIATEQNIRTFKRQLKSLGLSYDWSREIDTTDPKYYKWTQWLFLQFLKHGLAYKKKMSINWCPKCKTGLANEEVVNGRCERCGTLAERKEMEQWMLAITKYADRLIEGLETVDYLERIKSQQINWIGRSEGINIDYEIENTDKQISVYTTRPDTNFGATFVVMAPDLEFVKKNLTLFPNSQEVERYIEATGKKTELERIAEGRKKTGVFTGWYAINKLTDKKMPVYLSDFVLATVGTGVVVGVPGHDLRDFEFAKEMGLEIIRVVVGVDGDVSPINEKEQVQEDAGKMINSGFLDGLDIQEAKEKIKDYLEEKGWGKRVVNYKLRDWIFSRQHYWGEPIPVVHCELCGTVPVPEDQLPVELPAVESYEPTDTGESPLAKITDWVNTVCPTCGGPAKRETDTMPNWAGSSWYFLRYIDPDNNQAFADAEKLKYWMQVDLYNGGMEHTTLHLLYSRFWNMFLYDIGLVPTSEPYARRRSHGMVLAEDGKKMSKSLGNVINPDEVVSVYGADTLRLYEMFMGPFDQAIPWDTKSIFGMSRFINKVWNLATEKTLTDCEIKGGQCKCAPAGLPQLLHKTIKKVTEDIEDFHFNTAISQMMIFVNFASKFDSLPKPAVEKFLQILSPFAPHIAEELWDVLGRKESIFLQVWPEYNKELIKDEMVNLVVQINGKVRETIKVEVGVTEEEAKKLAALQEKIKPWLEGKEIIKIIFVPDKLINIVVR